MLMCAELVMLVLGFVGNLLGRKVLDHHGHTFLIRKVAVVISGLT